MGANDLSIEYSKKGSALVVEVFVEKVIADWWVRHVLGSETVCLWQGRTDDPKADVAPVNVATLTDDSSLNWVVLLYGPNTNMTVAVGIEVRQGGTLLGSKSMDVSLTARKATQESGNISLAAR